jgi:hypothetical protein
MRGRHFTDPCLLTSGHSNVSAVVAIVPTHTPKYDLYPAASSSWAPPSSAAHGTSPASRAAPVVSPAQFFTSHFPNTESISAVVWTKSNPTPWNDVKQDENVKMMAVNQKFERRFVWWLLVVGMTFCL